MKKLLRILPLVIIAGLVVAIPASTQIFRRSATADAEGANLQLLVLVNRMELSTEQMQEIHDILAGLLDDREARDDRVAELEDQMIAFNGTAEELDGILEAFRSETQEQAEGSQERMADAIDQIKEILSLKQGEVLAEALPGLLGDTLQLGGMHGTTGLQRAQSMGRMMQSRRMGGQSGNAMQGRMLEQLKERLEGHAEVLEGLRDRLGGFFGRSTDGEDEDVLGTRGRMRLRFEEPGQTDLAGGQGADVIEQLVEVLELKLEALE